MMHLYLYICNLKPYFEKREVPVRVVETKIDIRSLERW